MIYSPRVPVPSVSVIPRPILSADVAVTALSTSKSIPVLNVATPPLRSDLVSF